MIETFGDMVRITSTDYNDNALFVIREILFAMAGGPQSLVTPHLAATVNSTTMHLRDGSLLPPFGTCSIHHAIAPVNCKAHRAHSA